MNPLKQSGPAGEPGQQKIDGIGVEGEYKPFFIMPQANCVHCAFYEVIHKARRHYGLCHLSGLRNPIAGQNGCCFIAGKWEELDEILGLTQGNSNSILEFPLIIRGQARALSITPLWTQILPIKAYLPFNPLPEIAARWIIILAGAKRPETARSGGFV